MSFTPYPAIDLKGGQVVRLKRGDMAQATVYGDPATQARAYVEAGSPWLHVVDLDGAFAGRPANAEAVRAILAAPTRPMHLGRVILDTATVEACLEAGVVRVILASVAAQAPSFARAACRAHPGRVAIGIDARDGLVATEGWAETGTLTALDLALMLEDAGAAAVIHTDIDRDGMLGGVNVEATAALAARLSTPVIASGGVAGPDDLAALRATGTIAGVIIGRALYDGRLTAQDALAAA